MYNTIYPNYINTYKGIINKRITKKEDDEKNSQSSKQAENDIKEEQKHPAGQSFKQTTQFFPNGEKVAIDYTRRQIGIDQVLTDFRNTANAIGAPDEIKGEVFSYLSLVESQSKKSIPNQQIIQSNLKNASQILDEYITNTLKKPSKVVENWVDALFLQQIDYKSKQIEQPQEQKTDENTIIQPQIKEEENSQTQEISTTEAKYSKSDFYVPENPDLRRKILQAKKYISIDENEKALYSLQNAMDIAQEIGDNKACAIIHYEEGRLYDGFNQIEDALYNYNRAAKQSTDNNIKARAHYSMGKIYDDFVKFEPAVEHLAMAVSYAGEADNLKLQTQALSNLAKVHADRYDKKNSIIFMGFSDITAKETKDDRIKAITFGKNGKYCEKLNEKARALEYYKNSSASYNKINDDENLAKNYKEASKIMLEYGNKAKAKTLLSKAYLAVLKTDNAELKREITIELSQI